MQVVRNQVSQKIIAGILQLEFGDSRFLHYGLFSSAVSLRESAAPAQNENAELGNYTLADGQSNFSAKLISLIQNNLDADARILIAGSTLSQLAMDCAARKLNTLLLNDDSSLGDRLGGEVEGLEIKQESLLQIAEDESFDLILLQGSYCYSEQLSLLVKSRRLLADGGKLLLFGEFLDDDSKIEYSPLANSSSLFQLAERLGYTVLDHYQCDADAIKSLQLFMPLLEKHKRQLCSEFDISDAETEEYLQHLGFIEKEFLEHRRCFRIVLFEHSDSEVEEYTNAEYGDINSFAAEEVATLFEESFNVPFNAELWDWKYVKGRGTCVVARLDYKNEDGGKIVAHYGGAPRSIYYFGKLSMAIQPCDVMVQPEIRRKYGRSSLFFKVAATFLEREIGNTVKHLLGFGFPNQKTMNISIRMGLYEKTDEFVEVLYSQNRQSKEEGERKGEEIREEQKESANDYCLSDFQPENEEHHKLLNGLWQQMYPDFESAIIGVRDWEYVKYRYFDHPFATTGQYRCVLLRNRKSGKALAFVVLKDHGDQHLLMDLICGRPALQSAIRLLNQLLMREEPGRVLKIWITKNHVESILLDGAIENELGIEIPCNSWNLGPSSETLYGAWWLTAGDMDFV